MGQGAVGRVRRVWDLQLGDLSLNFFHLVLQLHSRARDSNSYFYSLIGGRVDARAEVF